MDVPSKTSQNKCIKPKTNHLTPRYVVIFMLWLRRLGCLFDKSKWIISVYCVNLQRLIYLSSLSDHEQLTACWMEQL